MSWNPERGLRNPRAGANDRGLLLSWPAMAGECLFARAEFPLLPGSPALAPERAFRRSTAAFPCSSRAERGPNPLSDREAPYRGLPPALEESPFLAQP